ncbi:Hypothetical protein BROD_0403 [Brucella sp. NF 2653]|nr:Hypothetical protein BIBO1_0080 [Brucella inopinata BO1]EFM63517.1 Hypothetical protein BROD_0403 [Brucella sp. NF 2653]
MVDAQFYILRATETGPVAAISSLTGKREGFKNAPA